MALQPNPKLTPHDVKFGNMATFKTEKECNDGLELFKNTSEFYVDDYNRVWKTKLYCQKVDIKNKK